MNNNFDNIQPSHKISNTDKREGSVIVDYAYERTNFICTSSNEPEVDLDDSERFLYELNANLDEEYAEYNINKHINVMTQIDPAAEILGEADQTSQRFLETCYSGSQVVDCFNPIVKVQYSHNSDHDANSLESQNEELPPQIQISNDFLIGHTGEITEQLHEVNSYLRESRCVVHVDIDCFYAQVETNRIGLSTDTPLVVQQWGGLLAVNYAARKYGILRLESPQEARVKCEGLVVVHVPTYAQGDKDFAYNTKPKFSTHKASLAPYREASDKIFKLFNRFSKLVQKGGCDEAFIDLTEQANLRILKDCQISGNFGTKALTSKDWAGYGHVIGGFELPKYQYFTSDPNHPNYNHDSKARYWRERQLLAGAKIVNEIRAAVLYELKYTCGAGIAHNKHMAKLCSAENKPNQQTILRETYALDFLEDFPVRKIRFLAGKIGKRVAENFGKTCGEIWNTPLYKMKKILGEKNANFVYDIVRGINHKPVRPCKPPLSIMSGKTLLPLCDNFENLKKWVDVLCCEVLFRLNEVYVHNLWPKTLTLSFGSNLNRESISRYATFPTNFACKANPAIIYNTAIKMMCDLPELLPCSFVYVMASGLETSLELTNHRITEYFQVARPAPLPEEILNIEAIENVNFLEPCSSLIRKPDFFECTKCRESIHVAKQDIHDDYHLALQIQKQFDEEAVNKICPESQPWALNPSQEQSILPEANLDLPNYHSTISVQDYTVKPIVMSRNQSKTSDFEGRHRMDALDDSYTELSFNDLTSSPLNYSIKGDLILATPSIENYIVKKVHSNLVSKTYNERADDNNYTQVEGVIDNLEAIHTAEASNSFNGSHNGRSSLQYNLQNTGNTYLEVHQPLGCSGSASDSVNIIPENNHSTLEGNQSAILRLVDYSDSISSSTHSSTLERSSISQVSPTFEVSRCNVESESSNLLLSTFQYNNNLLSKVEFEDSVIQSQDMQCATPPLPSQHTPPYQAFSVIVPKTPSQYSDNLLSEIEYKGSVTKYQEMQCVTLPLSSQCTSPYKAYTDITPPMLTKLSTVSDDSNLLDGEKTFVAPTALSATLIHPQTKNTSEEVVAQTSPHQFPTASQSFSNSDETPIVPIALLSTPPMPQNKNTPDVKIVHCNQRFKDDLSPNSSHRFGFKAFNKRPKTSTSNQGSNYLTLPPEPSLPGPSRPAVVHSPSIPNTNHSTTFGQPVPFPSKSYSKQKLADLDQILHRLEKDITSTSTLITDQSTCRPSLSKIYHGSIDSTSNEHSSRKYVNKVRFRGPPYEREVTLIGNEEWEQWRQFIREGNTSRAEFLKRLKRK